MRAGELASTGPVLRTYGLSAENERLGLPCGGRLGVVAEPCAAATHLAHIELGGLAARRCVRRELVLTAVRAGPRWSTPWSRSPSPTVCCATRWGRVFACCWSARDQVAQCVATLATMLDYRVVVCDPRAEQIAAWRGRRWRWSSVSRGRFPARCHCRSPHRDRDPDARSAHRRHGADGGAEPRRVLRGRARQRTHLGQAARAAARAGSSRGADRAAACAGAVGLSIGSKRPMEVAIAILAQLIALRRAEPGA